MLQSRTVEDHLFVLWSHGRTFVKATFAVCGLAAISTSIALAECPADPPPPDCSIDDQFIGGRWDLSQLSGTHSFSGDVTFFPHLGEGDPEIEDYYDTSGTLSVEMLGGATENFLDVACDGSVTGQGRERISGTISKDEAIDYDLSFCHGPPQDMTWTVTIERTYSITGSVSGPGQLDLDLQVDSATLDLSGNFAWNDDCIFSSESFAFTGFDLSGDVEQVRLSGNYDPANYTWQPTVSPREAKTWIDDIAHRMRLDGYNNDGPESTYTLLLLPPGSEQPEFQNYNVFFVQDAVTVTDNVHATAEPRTPIITMMTLQEPSQYLLSVNVDTMVVATIDWRGEPPGQGQVDFTYGGTMETVGGADTVSWTFDAGEAGATIEAVARNGSEISLPYIINTPKVAVPGWAGTSADWNGQSGVHYDSVLDWPISLEATRSINSLSLFTGLWGITGSASSTYDATAFSDGAPGPGMMSTDASLSFAGKQSSFHMDGLNQTTLACDQLTTTGSATSQLASGDWQKTLNPLTAIPGLQSAVCGLSGLLCGVINSVGIKGSATASLAGTGTYSDVGSQIEWDGGSLSGDISARVSAGFMLPPPLSKVAGVSIYGGGTGCIELAVAPSFLITKLGVDFEVGANASFMGLTASASEHWPIGDACGGRLLTVSAPIDATSTTHLGSGVAPFVPADGQLAMATVDVGGDQLGIAVWSELPVGQQRPSGDIRYRIFTGGAWGTVHSLTADAISDVAPAVEFDELGRALIVYQRSAAALPTDLSGLPDFANGYELHFAVVDPTSQLVLSSGALTTNTANDFGPSLISSASGKLSVFWQRASGIEISGTDSDPVSILTANWNASTPANGEFGAETVIASDLTYTFGFSAAVLSEGEMLVAVVIDTDEDFSTADDREVFQVSKLSGTWLAPVQVTSNMTRDDSVQVAFDSAGAPLLLWRQGSQVVELRDDLLAIPSEAFTTEDPTFDGGVDSEFAHGLLASGAGGDTVLWADGITLQLTRRESAPAEWSLPLAPGPLSSDSAQTVYAARDLGEQLLVSWATQNFNPDNQALEQFLLPRFARFPTTDAIFADGFEQGDVGAWSSSTP